MNEKFPEPMKSTNKLREIKEDFRNVLAYEPDKFYLMKCNIKRDGHKTKTVKFLVNAEDYAEAKELTNDFVKQHIHSMSSISNITGNEIGYDYLLKEKQEEEES